MIKNKMLRAEWKHLFSNKILLISMAVISFIPILYSGFFLRFNLGSVRTNKKLAGGVCERR